MTGEIDTHGSIRRTVHVLDDDSSAQILDHLSDTYQDDPAIPEAHRNHATGEIKHVDVDVDGGKLITTDGHILPVDHPRDSDVATITITHTDFDDITSIITTTDGNLAVTRRVPHHPED